MPRRASKKVEHVGDVEDLVDDTEPPVIEPYKVLDLEKTATADEVKQAYRKAALKHHPDKAPEDQKEQAHTKFQEVAFAYAILSDPIRRKRYDATGSTSESIDADDFSWSEFYSEQFRDSITSDTINTFAKAYKGSDEEKDDLLAAYERGIGSWARIYEAVMLSNPLEDEDRYRKIIDEAIEKGNVKSYPSYTKETQKAKDARMNAARREGKEAMAYAEELGVSDKLFGKKDGKKKDSGEDGLAALIKSRQAARGGFFDHLEAKYGGGGGGEKKSKKGKKRGLEAEEGPSEEAFQAAAARLDKQKAKRAKR